MEISDQLQALKALVSSPESSKEEFISAIEAIFVWLTENNTDENCRLVDNFVSTEISLEDRKKLPEEFQSLLFDMGGALHDTHTNPEVARNFESTPEQLLERVRAMKSYESIQETDRVEKLAARISSVKDVLKFDTENEPAAWNIAYTFSELEGSFRKFLDQYLTKLNSDDLQPAEVYELLLEIGEEFRHIHYHLRDAPFYSYIFDSED